MPCYEINTYTLAFKATNLPLIMDALKDMKLNPRYNEKYKEIETDIGTFDLETGEVEVRSRFRDKVNDFRKRYSEKVIGLAAKKFKWNIKKQRVKGKTVFNAVKW